MSHELFDRTVEVPASVRPALTELRDRMMAMKTHRAFSMIDSTERLQTFMHWHVYPVWDFMSLVKRLQIDFTHTSLPWLPPKNPKAARLINEIVLGEETDENYGGGHTSHFQLYLSAMREIGADCTEIEQFITHLASGETVAKALTLVKAPEAVANFVNATLTTATQGDTSEVLGSFFFGREDPIPQMFKNILAQWSMDPKKVPTFVFYLERHIELDTDSHGPAAMAIIKDVLGQDEQAWQRLVQSALSAVSQRVALWDALASQFERQG